VGHLGDNIGQRCFAASGWTRNNQRRETVGFDRATQKFSRREDMFLSDKFIECAWTHARREGSGCANPLQVFRLGFGEQIVHRVKMYGEGWLGASVNIQGANIGHPTSNLQTFTPPGSSVPGEFLILFLIVFIPADHN
jgi:hypothetical protein